MVLLYSLDCEWVPVNGVNVITEVGFTVYDGSRVFPYHYIISEAYHLHHPVSHLKRKFDFVFKSVVASRYQVFKYIQDRLHDHDIILIGHDIMNDIYILKQNGVMIPSTLTVQDTQKISTYANGPRSFQKCLEHYGVSYAKHLLHNGGNDAWYSLRLYLKMVSDFNTY